MSGAAVTGGSTAGEATAAGTPAAETGGGASERFVARAAAVTAGLTALGALLGLLRDQTLARLFGAGAETDAFLVSWTLPEVASTLLIEDAMALVLVPAFSFALARRAAGPPPQENGPQAEPDPVRELLRATLPKLLPALAAGTAATALAAPLLVRYLTPGLARPDLAADCTRLTALTVLLFGTAGYLSAVLRAHRSFVPPAAIYAAYNVGIIGTALLLHAAWGVRAAAAGVAVGGGLMVLVQLPSFLRRLPPRRFPPRRFPPRRFPGHRRGLRAARVTVAVAGPAVIAPVALYALSRQAQVFVERYLAASLPPGAISHLNYAQKVGQLPMVLSLMICTVTLPLVASALADGDTGRARRRVERDLGQAGALVLLGTAFAVALAPQIVQVLFQRGAFDAQATAATAGVLRVYAFGLLGHTLVGALVRPFCAARPSWYPLAAMAAGLAVTVVAGAAAVGPFGARGLAAANAAGIWVAALLLLRGLSRRRVPLDVPGVLAVLARLAGAAGAAAVAGWAAGRALGLLTAEPAVSLAAGCLVVPAVFAAAARAARVPRAALPLNVLRDALRRGGDSRAGKGKTIGSSVRRAAGDRRAFLGTRPGREGRKEPGPDGGAAGADNAERDLSAKNAEDAEETAGTGKTQRTDPRRLPGALP